MSARKPVKLTRRAVDALSVEAGDVVVWDRDLPGFGIRVHASSRKVWCVQTRDPAGRPKRFATGPYGGEALGLRSSWAGRRERSDRRTPKGLLARVCVAR